MKTTKRLGKKLISKTTKNYEKNQEVSENQQKTTKNTILPKECKLSATVIFSHKKPGEKK